MLDYDNKSILGEFESQFFGDPKSVSKEICFLMPTGMAINLRVEVKLTFAQIKNQLWKQVEKLPGYETLHVPTRYAFNCYNSKFEKEEIFEETTRLRDMKIFRSMILVVERIGDKDEKLYNMRIGSIICLPVFRILSMAGKEEKDFRKQIHAMCEEVVNERKNETIIQRMEEVFPPILLLEGVALSNDILENSAEIKFHVHYCNDRFSYNAGYKEAILKESGESSPEQILQSALGYWYKLGEIKESEYDTGLYFLKVAGAEEYLYGDHQIIYFKYVQKCLNERKMVKLICVKRASLQSALAYQAFKRCSSIRSTEPDENHVTHKPRDLWDIGGTFSITVCRASNVLGGEDGAGYFVQLCLYHGGEPLVSDVKTQVRTGFPDKLEWNERKDFDINILDLPPNVRLCCVLYSVKGKKKRTSLAWVNIPLFDYKSMLKSGEAKLNMWECNADDESFNYIGTTTTNTKVDSVTLCLQFPPNVSNVKYPDLERICSLSANMLKQNRDESERSIKKFGYEKLKSNDRIVFCLSDLTEPPDSFIANLTRIVLKDPLEELFEDEKTLLWQMRAYCQCYLKNSLPKLLRSFDWSDHKKVATMKQLVKSWQPLDPEYALELLDYQYPDVDVRDFAVTCLENLSDAQLGLYLLQLVQVLKYESYLDNSLTRFLLRRSIKNSRIGHNFFWHLRSEIHEKEVTNRFGLISEAYCRSNSARTEQLWAQHVALELFHTAAKKAKEETVFREGQSTQSTTLQQVRATLELGNSKLIPYLACSAPHIKIRSVISEKCKVMDSKKKPLWITCENDDDLGDNLVEMYKVGDDLRQDSLTLQTIGLMDQLWQNHQMDLKLNVYGCISTGANIGLITPVKDSVTLSAIQTKYGGAFTNEALFKWLKDQNKTEAALEEAISNFSKSCAGYCVATYILGIGDRHNDNIMITKTGKLFHIDFGHFLGNYKSFALGGIGFKRERVPMIMLSDFVFIITKGKHSKVEKAKDDPNFKKFLETCLLAFRVIRNKSTLFINLFALMCSSGIPELSSLDDLQYLRTALSLDESEEEAVNNFKKKMFEALKNERWAKINFWAHIIAHK